MAEHLSIIWSVQHCWTWPRPPVAKLISITLRCKWKMSCHHRLKMKKGTGQNVKCQNAEWPRVRWQNVKWQNVIIQIVSRKSVHWQKVTTQPSTTYWTRIWDNSHLKDHGGGEFSWGKILSNPSLLARLKQWSALKILFSKTNYPTGLSLIQPYLL